MTKRKTAGEQENRIVYVGDTNLTPPLSLIKPSASASGHSINPPSPPGQDRNKTSRDRYRDKQKGKAKSKIGDILRGEPVITQPGKIKIPVDGDKEPTWRPGRDGKGGPGGPGPGKPGSDPGDYVEVTWEEFIEMFFEAINLPYLLKKQMSQSLVKTHKRRGITNHGPKPRLSKRETAKARLKRVVGLQHAQPEKFIEDFESKCQSVFDAYVFWAAVENGIANIIPEPIYKVIGGDILSFLEQVETAGGSEASLPDDEADALRTAAIDAVQTWQAQNESAEQPAPYACFATLSDRIAAFVIEKEDSDSTVPSIADVPFHQTDLRYNRIEEKDEPDSKAVVYLVMDRSGSMQGDPLSIAKAWFLINVLFLRTKYKTVELVLISHDSREWVFKTEEEFFKIGAGGGTVAAPAWDFVVRSAEVGAVCQQTTVSAGPFPRGQWNRYMFHATDGDLFDGDAVIQGWFTKIIKDSAFNYCGYLECGTPWGGYSSGYSLGGRALLGLPAEIKAHLGMARANTLAEVPDAFIKILDKDRKK